MGRQTKDKYDEHHAKLIHELIECDEFDDIATLKVRKPKNRVCVSKGARGAMATPLFEALLHRIYSNFHCKICHDCNGNPTFENLMGALQNAIRLSSMKT